MLWRKMKLEERIYQESLENRVLETFNGHWSGLTIKYYYFVPCGGKGGGGARVVCGVEGGRVETEVLGALESKADFPCGMMK